MFHKHNYSEVSAVFTPSLSGDFKAKSIDSHTMMKLAYGFTTIKLVCDKCGNIIFRETPGDQR